MSHEQCPLCFSPLEVREVAPCAMCGAVAEEVEHALEGRHTFAEYRVLGEVTLVLCDFCQVDIGSYAPDFWGFADDRRIQFSDLELVPNIENISIGRDKYCARCSQRLTLLAAFKQFRDLRAD